MQVDFHLHRAFFAPFQVVASAGYAAINESGDFRGFPRKAFRRLEKT